MFEFVLEVMNNHLQPVERSEIADIDRIDNRLVAVQYRLHIDFCSLVINSLFPLFEKVIPSAW